MDKNETKSLIGYEKSIYFNNYKSYLYNNLANSPSYQIWRWLYNSRKNDYYSQFYDKGIFGKIIAIYYLRKRNILAGKLGFDIDTRNIGKGLLIYHPGATVINGGAIIGENCILHGNNCIGNKGPAGSPCPVIGNNVEIGVGAKIIGGVTIADNIKIGAGAVVVSSFLEKGITIGGIPAKKLNS